MTSEDGLRGAFSGSGRAYRYTYTASHPRLKREKKRPSGVRICAVEGGV